MRYRRILFLIPPLTQGKPRNPFTGIGYLSSFLSAQSIDNDVLDMNLNHNLPSVWRKIKEFNPDLIGVFLMTFNHKNNFKIINEIKHKLSIDIVTGGPHVSIMRTKVLEQCSADYAIKLEGEFTLKELMSGKQLEDIPGLIYRKGKEIIENKDREFICNLDEVPYPTFEKYELDKYYGNSIPVISSRGCPYSCIYCPVKSAIGRQFRVRSAENVVSELEFWHKKGYRSFEFMDDNFTLLKERVIAICELIQQKNLHNIVLACPNGIRADRVDKDLLLLMKRTGFKTLSFGVEGGNNKILKNLRKSENIETIETSIKDACELGFDVSLFFLIGSPGETKQDVMDSVQLALKYPINNVFFYSLIPYPETELYEWVSDNNYFLINPEDYLSSASANESNIFFSTPEFTAREKREMLIYTKKIQRKVRLNSIKRRFFNNSLLGKLLAPLLVSNVFQNYIMRWNIFWKLYNRYLTK